MRDKTILTISVDHACLQFRFLEFVKLCEIHIYIIFDLREPHVFHHFSHFQFSKRWRHRNMRPCSQHLAGKEYLQPLVEEKGWLWNKTGRRGGFWVISTSSHLKCSWCKNSTQKSRNECSSNLMELIMSLLSIRILYFSLLNFQVWTICQIIAYVIPLHNIKIF